MIFGNKEQILYGNRFNGTKGNGYQPIKKEQTNEEWLHTLPMEEMADEIIGHIAHEIGLARYYNDDDVKEFVKWLKQPHTITSK